MDVPAMWLPALSLPERLRALKQSGRLPLLEPSETARGRLRVQTWRQQAPFSTGTHFENRLALDGATEEDLVVLLGATMPAQSDVLSKPPPWVRTLIDAFSSPPSGRPSVAKSPSAPSPAGFLDLIEPLTTEGTRRLAREVARVARGVAEPPFDPATVGSVLFAELGAALFEVLFRTMTLELNVARLNGRLCGELAQERFNSFLVAVGEPPCRLAILGQYPVLARQVFEVVDRWVAASVEFLERLCADRDAIRDQLAGSQDIGTLVRYHCAGDHHRGGRSVVVAEFSSGFRAVYKPRSLSVDSHFQQLLAWLNSRHADPPFATLRLIDRVEYGWSEFVSGGPCRTKEEVRRFHLRLGSYLALLFALEATDIHFENVIASGEHPYLIDLESLFHAPARVTDMSGGARIDSSVLRVGLLPNRLYLGKERHGIDLSGMVEVSGQLTPTGAIRLEAAGTDEMRIVAERTRMRRGQNRPTLVGADVNAFDYTEEVVEGFRRSYRTIQDHRSEMLAVGALLERFAADEVRVVFRMTHAYAQLLRASYHPDFQRDALDRDRLFDKLWFAVPNQPEMEGLIPSEIEALRQGDVPMFNTRPGSRDLWCDGGRRISEFYETTGLERVRNRITSFDEEECERQCSLIRLSLATLAPIGEWHASVRMSRATLPERSASGSELVAAARKIGDLLESRAIRVADNIGWMGLATTPGVESRALAYSGLDLYDGLPGISLFLAQLGRVVGERRYDELAHRAVETLGVFVDQGQPPSTVGAFVGWGGVLYSLAHLGAMWHQDDVLDRAESLVERIAPLADQDAVFDLLGGSAGGILCLLALHAVRPSGRTLDAARRCGERLLETAIPMQHGIGWAAPGKTPLAGLSHGAAGIVAALLELARVSEDPRYTAAAREALTYERSLFVPAAGNWADLREKTIFARGETARATAWCTGAAGIGMARLRGLTQMDDAEVRDEIAIALRAVSLVGYGSNHSLCHGDLGNVELPLLASQVLDDADLREHTLRVAAYVLEDARLDGWRCGDPAGVETPGLMTGLAGIGYQLLRLADPKEVPSVLTLEPPSGAVRASTEVALAE